jgi:hypothetical protein
MKKNKIKTINTLTSETLIKEECNNQLIVTASGFVNVMPRGMDRDERAAFLNSCR